MRKLLLATLPAAGLLLGLAPAMAAGTTQGVTLTVRPARPAVAPAPSRGPAHMPGWTLQTPIDFQRLATTPGEDASRALHDVIWQRLGPADIWTEHGEVQVLNRHSLRLAREDRSASAADLSTPLLRHFDRARADLLDGDGSMAQVQLSEAQSLLGTV